MERKPAVWRAAHRVPQGFAKAPLRCWLCNGVHCKVPLRVMQLGCDELHPSATGLRQASGSPADSARLPAAPVRQGHAQAGTEPTRGGGKNTGQPCKLSRCRVRLYQVVLLGVAVSTPSATTLEPQVVGQANGRGADGGIVVAVFQILHKRGSSFQVVSGGRLRVGRQRGIAGAEIVIDAPHAQMREWLPAPLMEASGSAMAADSVISSQGAGSAAVVSRGNAAGAVRGRSNCTALRLTATLRPDKPWRCQLAMSAQAVRNAHSPMEWIRPSSSATAMNSSGEIRLASACRQRMKCLHPQGSQTAPAPVPGGAIRTGHCVAYSRERCSGLRRFVVAAIMAGSKHQTRPS